MLGAVGSLSRLFSESTQPYIAYRVAENLFCRAFDARNLSRGDTSADAAKDVLGFGIKTFLNKNGKSFEKVAEFNKDHALFSALKPAQKIIKIAELRNERIEATKRIAGINSLVYHCVTRDKNRIQVYEEPMQLVQIDRIKNLLANKSSISFDDGLANYKFSISKSTLYKRFVNHDVILDIPVRIMSDPFDVIEEMYSGSKKSHKSRRSGEEHIFLPLYSSLKEVKEVPASSGLNLWHAKGRPRDPNEVYIPIPILVHRIYPNFFPSRDENFKLHIPNGDVLSAKVCQDGSKALMTNPGPELGKWLLRSVLNLRKGELLTYEKLEKIGLDSVMIYKIAPGEYGIDFTQVGSYEDFVLQNTLRS